ncbi:MAG: hypothetical protein R3F48_14115 [Candidatus Zixiibacteriota bacterium]
MRKLICALGVAALICASAMAQVPSDTNLVNNDSLLNIGMDMALQEMLLTRGDFTFRDDYTPKDPYRLKIVDSLMSHPILMADFAEDCAMMMKNSPDEIGEYLKILFGENGERSEKCDVQAELMLPSGDGPLEQELFSLNFTLTLESAQRSTQIDCEVQSKLRDFIQEKFNELILDIPDYRMYSNEELDSMQHLEEEWAKEFSEQGAFIQYPEPESILGYKAYMENINEIIRTEKKYQKKLDGDKPVYESKLNFGKIIIGTEGNDTYTGDYFMILDPGGDDVYNLSYDINNPHPVIIADFAGDDTYNAETDFALACGALSFSLLIDYEGDDIYRAKSFGLGAGYFGVGILWDKKGDDKYFGDTFVEGAGTFGYGLLIDEEGSDIYTANLQSQGFGFVKGVGGIIDYAGNDSYIIQPKYKEYFHTGNHYTSLSQGFSIGVRPHMSGGFGFICDYGGNDSYLADFFAQASSYWWSLGMIYDKWGNDLYSTYQYAQGAGAHMTLGILIDGAGDDIYRSHGVCQGCGHDYSCGWLIDKGGNDVYTAHDLAQGAGQANGIGIFNDLGGDDGYYTHLKYNTQGYGNPRRDYGSIGIFTDMGGDDRFQGNGANNTIWRVPGKWGLGLDWEPPQPDTTQAVEGK